jgi:hypothetical protein
MQGHPFIWRLDLSHPPNVIIDISFGRLAIGGRARGVLTTPAAFSGVLLCFSVQQLLRNVISWISLSDIDICILRRHNGHAISRRYMRQTAGNTIDDRRGTELLPLTRRSMACRIKHQLSEVNMNTFIHQIGIMEGNR